MRDLLFPLPTARARPNDHACHHPRSRCNSPRLNDLASRSNVYLINNIFVLTIDPFRAIIPHEIGPQRTRRGIPISLLPLPTDCSLLTFGASYVFSTACSLFVVLKKANPFGIKQIQALLPKYPGWGYRTNLWTTRADRFHAPSPVPASPFRINTCKSATKQKTSTPFRSSLIKKQEGEGILLTWPRVQRSSGNPATFARSAKLRNR